MQKEIYGLSQPIQQNIRPPQKKTRFWIDNEILEVYGSRLKASGIALYCALARHANSKTQLCFPAYPRLMELSGIGKRNTISKYLKIIEDLGLVLIVRNKKRQPNKYYMLSVGKDGIQIATTKKEHVDTQKDILQYPNIKVDSAEKGTLNKITKLNKEVEDFSIKEELKKPRFKDYKPSFLK
jgi:hypothetical protein